MSAPNNNMPGSGASDETSKPQSHGEKRKRTDSIGNTMPGGSSRTTMTHVSTRITTTRQPAANNADGNWGQDDDDLATLWGSDSRDTHSNSLGSSDDLPAAHRGEMLLQQPVYRQAGPPATGRVPLEGIPMNPSGAPPKFGSSNGGRADPTSDPFTNGVRSGPLSGSQQPMGPPQFSQSEDRQRVHGNPEQRQLGNTNDGLSPFGGHFQDSSSRRMGINSYAGDGPVRQIAYPGRQSSQDLGSNMGDSLGHDSFGNRQTSEDFSSNVGDALPRRPLMNRDPSREFSSNMGDSLPRGPIMNRQTSEEFGTTGSNESGSIHESVYGPQVPAAIQFPNRFVQPSRGTDRAKRITTTGGMDRGFVSFQSEDAFFAYKQAELKTLREAPKRFHGFPTTDAEKLNHVKQIMAAIKDTTQVGDGAVTGQAVKAMSRGVWSDRIIETTAWELLYNAGAHQGGGNILRKKFPENFKARDYDSFQDRFLDILDSLRESKNLCKDLLSEHSIPQVAVNAPQLVRGKKMNSKLNGKRNVEVKYGKEVIKHLPQKDPGTGTVHFHEPETGRELVELRTMASRAHPPSYTAPSKKRARRSYVSQEAQEDEQAAGGDDSGESLEDDEQPSRPAKKRAWRHKLNQTAEDFQEAEPKKEEDFDFDDL